MKWRPWAREHADTSDIDAASRRVRQLEARAEKVARHVNERDPWASRVIDTIHRFGDPHAR